MGDTPKRFDDWEKVDCNECARYWDSSCDGIAKGTQKQCNSYVATRSIVIPSRIKTLEKSVRWLRTAVWFLLGWDIVHMIGELLFG